MCHENVDITVLLPPETMTHVLTPLFPSKQPNEMPADSVEVTKVCSIHTQTCPTPNPPSPPSSPPSSIHDIPSPHPSPVPHKLKEKTFQALAIPVKRVVAEQRITVKEKKSTEMSHQTILVVPQQRRSSSTTAKIGHTEKTKV